MANVPSSFWASTTINEQCHPTPEAAVPRVETSGAPLAPLESAAHRSEVSQRVAQLEALGVFTLPAQGRSHVMSSVVGEFGRVRLEAADDVAKMVGATGGVMAA